ncbi:trimeric intracellular cation channel family protein [Roseisolibacter sp. H3M3-2]|uniref:trimeric intracellular cation channel family protein n=1 Tax=Roseisolibacter sp. H3M3-2 TaxID=3031323 RepID=UPI0023DB7722|nr:trimeric intracellular cation channel family protein [Roseisolibacter sp. H3M3-2]MDF1503672.1 trimeric intracellular cation channel family protein [Roseisolibacter sp. H3M3-2]
MLLYVLDLIGVAVFAVSGALAAGRKRLDLFGVLVLALVTAIGGGTIRDVLLDRHPLPWLADRNYLLVVTASALGTVWLVRRRRTVPPDAALQVADALGLALFAVAGAQIAERAGMPAGGSILLGTVTGAAGGAVRDVLCAEIPLVLRRGNLYASAAIAGTAAYFGLEAAGVTRGTATLLGMAIVAGVRLAAIWWGLQLPEFRLHATDEHAVPPGEGR